jgi:DNA alkylation repair enzyme
VKASTAKKPAAKPVSALKGEAKARQAAASSVQAGSDQVHDDQVQDDQVESALQWLKSHSTKSTLDGMSRYGIPSKSAIGVAMRDIKALGMKLGRNQPLAAALWSTGVYEARMLAIFRWQSH